MSDEGIGRSYAVMWGNGKIFELESLPGTLGNSAIDINNHDQIIGETTFLDASHENQFLRNSIAAIR